MELMEQLRNPIAGKLAMETALKYAVESGAIQFTDWVN